MSPWSVAVAVEVAGCALFTGALLLLRPWLRAPVLRIWALLWIGRGIASLIVFRFVAAPTYFSLLLYIPLQFALALALAFAGRSLVQHKVQIARLQRQLDQLQRELVTRVDLDPLTGLLNRSALARWLEEETHFQGMVVVCDLDGFKPLNDSLGHLVGDEILRNIGQLLRASMRQEDAAFRWGGDEFVLCFRTVERELVEKRMRQLEERLGHFRVRNHGVVSLRFTWGTCSTLGHSLQEALDEADRQMLDFKQVRRGRNPVAER